jgi:hypothetical protein
MEGTSMVTLAAFRIAENSFLLAFALCLLVPCVFAIWGQVRYPQVAFYSTSVIAIFDVLVGVPISLWLASWLGQWGFLVATLFFFAVIPTFITVWGRHSYPQAVGVRRAFQYMSAALVGMALWALIDAQQWKIGGFHLYWSPSGYSDLGLFLCFAIMWLSLFPAYLGLSIALSGAIYEARKHERLAR